MNKYQEASEAEQRILNDYYSKIMIATNDSSQITVNMKELKEIILEMTYPVGSVYTSKEDKDPSTFIGGKWKRVEKGRFLMNADDTHAGGTIVEAGLPNITGYFEIVSGGTGNASSGALWVDNYMQGATAGDSTLYSNRSVRFDASRSNAVYGKSNTVQPPAYVVYMWERIE